MKSISFRIVLLGLFCGPMAGWAQDDPVAATLGYPDKVIHNARIVTMDDASFTPDPGTIAEAMAVRDDKILAVGSNRDIRALAGPDTEQIDLGGRTVVPGIILTHEHPTDWAWTEPTGLNHVFPAGNEHIVVHFMEGNAEEQLASWEAELAEAVSKAEPGQWILFSSDWGGNFEHMPELFPKFLPQISRQRLDEIAPDNPVRVKNSWVDGLVNTRALEEAKRVFPDQKVEGRGNRGPTGRQLEPDVMLHNKVELNADLLEAQMQLWAAHGVTVYGSSPYTIGNLNALRILDEEGRMPGRFAWSYTGPDLHYQTLRLVSALLGNGTDHLWNIGAHGERSGGTCTTLPASERVKAQEDCSLEPGDDGRRVKEDIVRSGGRIGAMHSGGDKDIDHLLDIIEEQSKVAGLSLEEVRKRRHAFDHASGAPRPDQIPRIKNLGMMVSMINTVIWENRTGYDASYRLRNYGAEYIHLSVPRNSVTKAGIMATQEIDRALPHFLFYNVWVGMTRYNSGVDLVLAPEEGTDLMTQMKGLTIWGAYYVLREDRLGSLEPGKLADFVVLDKDVFSVPRDDIPNVKALMTVIGGKTVHLLPALANELGAAPVGAATWPTKPLQTRYVFKGPPAIPEYMRQ
ncbi:MAG: amidohydrolase family protein [Gammaproteobacteria bacterium]|nr:amidohydrolase family protein [Gammaproteobacteria bacterium]